MALDRSEGRDVHIYNAKDPTQTVLGGLHLTNGITNALFYSMIEIILVFQSTFSLQDENEVMVERDNHPLQPGKYYVNGSFLVTDESPLTRTISLHTGTRHETFRHAVRARDHRCVVTGKPVLLAYKNSWTGFEAAHIFPLAYQGYWNDQNFSRWITTTPTAGEPINSDNYKIVCFELDADNFAGTYIDQQLLNHPDRPIDQLLGWHFRQAVLINMKGAGEPIFEHDFPPGSDMLDDIRSGPKAVERMEFELHSRLTALL
ncbi:hypothetical protein MMC17_001139 [Xylographa soralifera]|nr:hypothetical protein [Xylographa soralifera]